VKTQLSPLFFSLILVFANPIITSESYSLTLIITTTKQHYYLGENVTITGNLTLDNVLIENALVAIEVIDSNNKTIVMRSLPTSPNPTQNWFIEIISVTPCDQWGNPKNSFQLGTLSYFNVTIHNHDIEIHQILISVNVYDSSNTPIGLSLLTSYSYPNITTNLIISVPIPTTATLGTATAYANIYSARPQIGGKSYGPEKSALFQIVSSSSSSIQTLEEKSTQNENGTFTTTFKLAPKGPAGAYIIYATSYTFEGYEALNTTTFYVKVPGDVDNNFRVDGADLALLGLAWWATPTDPHWNENCDFDQNERVDGGDLALMGMYWGYGF
jgi:hypothetical protein